MTILLDTHIWWRWVTGDGDLSTAQKRRLAKVGPENPALVSDISLWEIATLHSLGRIELNVPLRDWLEGASAEPLVQRRPISPVIAAEVAALPDSFHRDPADRIFVATARIHGATLLTRDEGIIRAKLVPTIDCANRLNSGVRDRSKSTKDLQTGEQAAQPRFGNSLETLACAATQDFANP